MQTVKDTVLAPLGDEPLSDLSSVTSLDPPEHATFALIQVFTNDVRITFDGTNPVASSNGNLLYSGDMGFWITSDLTKVRLLEETSSATAFVSYFK